MGHPKGSRKKTYHKAEGDRRSNKLKILSEFRIILFPYCKGSAPPLQCHGK